MESGRETRLGGSGRPPEADHAEKRRAWRPASIAFAVALAMVGMAFVAPSASAKHFQAEFDPKPGNEWWVEVFVDGNEPIEQVDARANEGPWHELELRDWGAWAKSFHVPEGSVVEFRAIGSGEAVFSEKYLWPSAERLHCPPAFEAEFDPKPGNEWWVEVDVDANARIDGVDARVDGGQWHALELKDWGSWAKSFHVEDGSEVDFRARSGDSVSFSDVYRWPEAEFVREGPTLDVAFGPKASNEWWVETYAIAEHPIEKVEACRGDGVWHELEFRDWHAWAKSFHVFDGSVVQFRATDDRGVTDETDEGFEWPSAKPVDLGPRPREGDYAHYELEWGAGPEKHGDVDAIFVHHDGTWFLMCEGDGAHGADFFEFREMVPPFGPSETSVGQDEQVETLHGCDKSTIELTVLEQRERDTRQNGDPVTVTTWYGERITDFDHRNADWETNTGLLVRHTNGGTGWSNSELQDTKLTVD